MPYTFNPFTGTLDNIGNSVLFSGEYLPLSGGIITGNLGVSGTTTLSGTTIIGDESQIATIFVDNGRVGINNEDPNEALTIVGNVSATGFYYGDGSQLTGITTGDTVATTLVRTNSANWDSVYSTVQSKSATEWDNSLANSYTHLNFLPLSGGTLTGKLTAAANSSNAGLNIGTALAITQPSLVDNGDIWISNQNRFTWRSGGNSIAAAGLSQQNTFNNAQTIGASTPSTLLNVGNTGGGSAAIFSAQGVNVAVRITQTGTGNAFIVEDETNPDSDPFIINNIGSVGIGLSSVDGIDAKLTVVGNVSATGFYYGDGSQLTGIVAGDTAATTLVRANSANWDSVYSTVQTNSADNWNYQGTDLKNLSANWESTYSTVSSLSSGWLTTNYLSTNNILLSGLTVTTTISAKDKIYVNDKQVVTTNNTTVNGISAITSIVAVSALPIIQDSGILYILV